MKLRNKKTGEIVYATMMASYGGGELQIRYYPVNNAESTHFKEYRSISELNEEWEDYEEDELLYVISAEHKSGYQCVLKEEYPEICEVAKELGIGFETEKECQEFCNKLLAWKRLKDEGFRFTAWYGGSKNISYEITSLENGTYIPRQICDDLDLLFGGEE